MITTAFFDLDGTLLPLDQDTFIKKYFEYLTACMAHHGYEPKKFFETVYNGCMKMLKNNSGETNEKVFWKNFTDAFGQGAINDMPLFDSFYKTDFQFLKEFSGYTPEAKKTVYMLKEKGVRVILATNPVFPALATESRIRWAGLEPTDFEIYTTYENSYHCKPSREYYQDVLNQAGVTAEECIMIGNDVSDDMPAEKMGMKVFLLTDCLINLKNEDIARYPHGGFEELKRHLLSLI